MIIYGCITDEEKDKITKAVISDPASGEYKITGIKFAADGKYIVKYDNTPTP